MNFLNEIREHLENFETEASDEINRFIDFLHTKFDGSFIGTRDAIVNAPSTAPASANRSDLGIDPSQSFIQPVIAPPPLKDNGDLPDLVPGQKYDFSLRPEVAEKMGLTTEPVAAINPEQAAAIPPVEAPAVPPVEAPTVAETPAQAPVEAPAETPAAPAAEPTQV